MTQTRQQRDARPTVGLGSAGAALLMVTLAVFMLIGAALAESQVAGLINHGVAEFAVLVAAGFAAATGSRNAERRLRRLGIHSGWRRSTAIHVAVVAGLTVAGPLLLVTAVRRWDALNAVMASIGPPNDGGAGESGSLALASALSGSRFVLIAAVMCATGPWLATAARDRIPPARRPALALAAAGFVGLARSTAGAADRVVDLPPAEAVFVGMAIALIPTTFVHRHPPHRLAVPALLTLGGCLVAVPANSDPKVQSLAIVAATLSLALLLVVGRLGMLPQPAIVSRLQQPGRLADNLMPLLPAAVAWHSVFLAIIVERARLGGVDPAGPWAVGITVSASMVIAVAAASVTATQLISLAIGWLTAFMSAQPISSWPVRLGRQWSVFRSARFESPASPQWDDQLAEQIGRPLPPRPTVPIRTSTIIHSGRTGMRVGRGSHRYRPPNRDQIPPPRRHTRASEDSSDPSTSEILDTGAHIPLVLE